jgi:hypothetical protein
MRNRILVAALFLMSIVGMKAARSSQHSGTFSMRNYRLHVVYSPEDVATATGKATMEFESDGNGRFTAGSLSEHLADDTRTFGEKACVFKLESGEYHMNSQTAGTSSRQ